jgi:hypothetical protein
VTARILFLLGVPKGELVANQAMQSNDRADQKGDVDDEHLVVGLDHHRLDELAIRDIRQQLEDVLQLVDDRKFVILVVLRLVFDQLVQGRVDFSNGIANLRTFLARVNAW